MAIRHPYADATYRVVALKDMTFGVEVSVPDTYPAMVTSFATEQAAEAWISNHRRKAEERNALKPRWMPKARVS